MWTGVTMIRRLFMVQKSCDFHGLAASAMYTVQLFF